MSCTKNTVNAAIANLPKLQATWKIMPVSACMNDSHPYQETNITLATMNGTTTGVNTGNSSTASPFGNNTASSDGSTPTGGKIGGSNDTSATVAATGEMKALAVIAVAAAAAAHMLIM
ncbi:hypothetical protein BGX27_001514 [Mortierella sp. AM989]|nr:hypothetical protein BGX27_001514 [Mortierella sp. AM989]